MPAYAVPALVEESEGLPLYVVEALAVGPAAAADGPPRGVRALLRERLGAVSARRPARCSRPAPSSGARSTSRPCAPPAADPRTRPSTPSRSSCGAASSGRSRGGERGTVFDFGHARLRDAAYEATSLARRRLLHRRVAEVLRAAADGRDDPGRLALIAGHERAAGRDAEAAEAFRDAGARARAVYANREALEHLGTALALGHPDVVGLETTIGEVRTALGDYAGAIAALEAAAAVTPRPGSRRSSCASAGSTPGAATRRPRPAISTARSTSSTRDRVDGRRAPARGDPRGAERGRGPLGRPRARRLARRAGPRGRHGRRRSAGDRRRAATAGPRGARSAATSTRRATR